jgi:hypothetical protein
VCVWVCGSGGGGGSGLCRRGIGSTVQCTHQLCSNSAALCGASASPTSIPSPSPSPVPAVPGLAPNTPVVAATVMSASSNRRHSPVGVWQWAGRAGHSHPLHILSTTNTQRHPQTMTSPTTPYPNASTSTTATPTVTIRLALRTSLGGPQRISPRGRHKILLGLLHLYGTVASRCSGCGCVCSGRHFIGRGILGIGVVVRGRL